MGACCSTESTVTQVTPPSPMPRSSTAKPAFGATDQATASGAVNNAPASDAPASERDDAASQKRVSFSAEAYPERRSSKADADAATAAAAAAAATVTASMAAATTDDVVLEPKGGAARGTAAPLAPARAEFGRSATMPTNLRMSITTADDGASAAAVPPNPASAGARLTSRAPLGRGATMKEMASRRSEPSGRSSVSSAVPHGKNVLVKGVAARGDTARLARTRSSKGMDAGGEGRWVEFVPAEIGALTAASREVAKERLRQALPRLQYVYFDGGARSDAWVRVQEMRPELMVL